MSERYTTVDCQGDTHGLFDTAEAAFAAIDKIGPKSTWAPYTVAKLVPVPRPVPPRPVAQIADLGCSVEFLEFGGRRVPCGIVSSKGRMGFSQITDILAAAKLIRATEEWEREHGGAQG